MRLLEDPQIQDYGRDHLEIACKRCRRYGKYRMDRVLRKVTPTCPFRMAVAAMAACPRTFYADPCQVQVVTDAPSWFEWEPGSLDHVRIRLRED